MHTVRYAIGDIHGCFHNLRDLWCQIEADATTRLPNGEKALVVFIGDYIDRGPCSMEVLAFCEKLRRNPPDWCAPVFLRGNHEEVLLAFLRDPSNVKLGRWLQEGGRETLESFGIRSRNATMVAEDLETALLPRLRSFLDDLRHSFEDGDIFFAHAGIRPGVALAKQAPRDLLWIREPFLSDLRDHGRIIVHGHTIEGIWPVVHPNRIGVDTGAYQSGVLSAVGLVGNQCFSLNGIG